VNQSAAVSQLLETEFDRFIRDMAEFFWQELADLDDNMEKDENDPGYVMSPRSQKPSKKKVDDDDSGSGGSSIDLGDKDSSLKGKA